MVNDMTNILRRINRNNLVPRIISLLISAFVLTFIYNKFLVTNQIVVGGISGLAILIEKVFHISTTLFINASNVILVILSFVILGKSKTIDQLIGCIVYILMLNVTAPLADKIDFAFESQILMIIVVSLVYGVCNGIIYRAGYSTGGTDFLSQILSLKMKKSITQVSLVIYISIILMSAFVLEIPQVLMSIFIIYVSNKITDVVLFGISSSKMVFILSERNDEIEDFVMNKIKIGATELKVRGGYKNEQKQMLLCVVHNTQYEKFKGSILKMDPAAFIITDECYEVSGGTKYAILPF